MDTRNCGFCYPCTIGDYDKCKLRTNDPKVQVDRLRKVNKELVEAFEMVLSIDVKGHSLQERLQFSPSGRAISEKARAAIAKAKGE